jgi:hypothetical protein
MSAQTNPAISICKKGKVKDETSKKIRETSGGKIKEQDVPLTIPHRCLLFLTSFFISKISNKFVMNFRILQLFFPTPK